jgi:hypothetical protein
MTPEERRLRGRIGAFAQHAQHDVKETTKSARAAFIARFLDEVDPDRVLDDDERNRRARAALSAHMSSLALRSVKARRSRRDSATLSSSDGEAGVKPPPKQRGPG